MIADDEMLEKYFSLDKIGHAYLLKTSNFLKVVEIAKKIFIKSNFNEPNIDSLIERGIYPDFKIIEPEGQWIKKEQILKLKDDFKNRSSYNAKQIYIIKNAENLNKSSGNTLLKFLEEPEENIIALLITENKTKVLETITSRCQYIVLDSNLEKESLETLQILKIISIMETKKQNSIGEIFELLKQIENKNEIKEFFLNIINEYDKIMLKMLGLTNCNFEDEETIDKITKNITIEDVKKRINGLMLIVDSLEYNVNIKLLVDKLIISMFGVE